MQLRFSKMHGLGNDFVVIDGISQRVKLNAAKVRKLADRHFGVGCDQVLLVEPPRRGDADFRYRIFNHDGSEVEQCGNGARCFARFVRDRKLTGRREIVVETARGLITLTVQSNDEVTVNMGVPRFAPAELPFTADAEQPDYELDLMDKRVLISALSMGNPHAVQIVADVASAPVATQGPEIERHPRFPNRVNAGFMQIVDRGQIHLRVYERGVGETLACGTGACAAVVAARRKDLVDSTVDVHLPGGRLTIHWAGPEQPVLMTGPATTVFHGQIRV